ncbi:UDP-N-acetylmuramoyl-tripeptide--D-alanyl-D-alanine ligase [Faecalicoccus pleomorphus]|uniref:UDP-N-acetylmuramoyl-tripeptide--D-alanyl-D-alanine ligase n=1 Tax=Faecalicoccus pleomorphus TaxID=1323 RepID=A0AAW6CVC6_9FIRM|nr:UDP-N-acetylmuramoyl-tripeptide--D-alanyl-D-alanine ligase [Faecalicoccus pleomorphus]MDB7980042.1 UDP-N-acetylmuramoyl-tripeptide--D-alanyl-D-alanine ligase [Faecalicoccus pleomorphus]MDB7982377.1 UDP-N-acetylmuramoyl-tripeptide--D-alanyl-D-alanine ligase [Faecalicoccus pleomorphus]
MINKTIQEVAAYLNAPCIQDEDDLRIHGVCIDSREVRPESLYIPILGQRVDGHSFVDSVRKAGCKASLWQKDHKPYPEDMALVLVEDTTQALQQLAKAYLQSLSCKVIAVTGSNGKTSCKDMLYSIFSQETKTQKTQGNRNNEIGLPLTILDFDADIEVAILEMGMENKGEIEFLCTIAPPDISVITTIGSAHMENLGGKKQIAQAKLEILENLKPNGLFLYDKTSPEIDECLQEMQIDPSKKIVSFGCGGDVILTSDIVTKEDHIEFTCSCLDQKVILHSLGAIQASNALPCIYIGLYYGLKQESILYGLQHLTMTKMRMQLVKANGYMILDDSYKSNPESAKAAIDALESLPVSFRIACLADMLDLGPTGKDLHLQIGEYASIKNVDVLYGYGPLTKFTVEGFQGKEKAWFETKEEMIEALRKYKDQDCAILIKGSRAMAMDEVVSALKGE